MIEEWYEVSLCPAGSEEWGEPCSVLAVNARNAVYHAATEAAEYDHDMIGAAWDGYAERDGKIEYFRITNIRRVVYADLEMYVPGEAS